MEESSITDIKPNIKDFFLDVKADCKDFSSEQKPDVETFQCQETLSSTLEKKPDAQNHMVDAKSDVETFQCQETLSSTLEKKPDVQNHMVDEKSDVETFQCQETLSSTLERKPDVQNHMVDEKPDVLTLQPKVEVIGSNPQGDQQYLNQQKDRTCDLETSLPKNDSSFILKQEVNSFDNEENLEMYSQFLKQEIFHVNLENGKDNVLGQEIISNTLSTTETEGAAFSHVENVEKQEKDGNSKNYVDEKSFAPAHIAAAKGNSTDGNQGKDVEVDEITCLDSFDSNHSKGCFIFVCLIFYWLRC